MSVQTKFKMCFHENRNFVKIIEFVCFYKKFSAVSFDGDILHNVSSATIKNYDCV